MALPTEYTTYLKKELNLVERFLQGFSSLDERIDFTNLVLLRIESLLRTGNGAGLPGLPGLPGDDSALISLSRGIVPNKNSFLHGTKTVVAAGTAIQLVTSDVIVEDGYQVTIVAKPGNTGIIYIGHSKGDAESAQKFDGLDAGLAISLKLKNLNEVWVNSSVNGDGVSWIFERDE